ncbi:efflux RND transporter periplasmic adaptor subunit [Croceiramulus getboli]|nr:HlyD family efflux transporter periplasmic adaptor subunit [Flavobacteriaceae bacterium YJPT1-3]
MNIKFESTVYIVLVALLSVSCGTDKPKETKEKDFKEFETLTVNPQEIKSILNLTGRVVPLQKVDIISEVQGTARNTSKSFEEGTSFRKGELLIAIDDVDFRYSLKAQKSQFLSAMVNAMADVQLDYPNEFPKWNAFLRQIDVQERLPELPTDTSEQLKYFLSSRNIFNLYYSIKSQENRLSDYRIYAPFNGSLTKAFIDVGDLVRPGTILGELIRTDVYEVRAAVTAAAIENFKIGDSLSLYVRNVDRKVTGTIKRIGKSLDRDTQSITIFIEVPGKDLKEGMYVETDYVTNSFTDAVELSNELISRDDRVFIIEDSVVVAKAVDILQVNKNTSIVKGLKEDDKVITEKSTTPIAGIKAVAKTK